MNFTRQNAINPVLTLTDEDIRLHHEGKSFAQIARMRRVEPGLMGDCFRKAGFSKRKSQRKMPELKASQFRLNLIQLGFF
jgi:hypothetical protein